MIRKNMTHTKYKNDPVNCWFITLCFGIYAPSISPHKLLGPVVLAFLILEGDTHHKGHLFCLPLTFQYKLAQVLSVVHAWVYVQHTAPLYCYNSLNTIISKPSILFKIVKWWEFGCSTEIKYVIFLCLYIKGMPPVVYLKTFIEQFWHFMFPLEHTICLNCMFIEWTIWIEIVRYYFSFIFMVR